MTPADDERDESPLDEDIAAFASEFVRCPSCGSEIYDDADVCPRCGDAVTRESRQPWVAYVAAALAALLVFGALIWLMG